MSDPFDTCLFRRHITEPVNVKGQSPLRIPKTPEVRRLLAGSSNLTLQDVAVDIVNRLLKLPGVNTEEIIFLRECMKQDRQNITVPCMISGDSAVSKQLQALIDLYCSIGGVSSPTSTASTLASTPNGSTTVTDFSEVKLDGRWPVQIDPAVRTGTERLLEGAFETWGFDIFALSEVSNQQPLLHSAWEAIVRGNLHNEFSLNPVTLGNFLQRVESSYTSASSVPYHNNIHAADVTQTVHCLLTTMGFHQYIDRLGRLALVLSAAVHDMGHDGFTNSFHVNTGSELAITYNDRSVQENFHISSAFKLLKSDGADLLSHFSFEQRTRTRKMMIDAVLGTDMACHFDRMGSMKSLHSKLGSSSSEWQSDRGAKEELQIVLLHAADISSSAKPASIAEKWIELLQTEFWKQGDVELDRKLPVSALCDRRIGNFASSQLGFIQFIVQPTFQLLEQISPEVGDVVTPVLKESVSIWEKRKEEEEEKSKALSRRTSSVVSDSDSDQSNDSLESFETLT